MNKQNQSTLIKKGISSFSLVGNAKINDYSFAIDKQSTTSDWIYNSLNLGVDCGNGNIVYSSLMGGYGSNRNNICYVHGKDENGKSDYSNTFQIDWEDRSNQNILDSIADDCFIKVGLEKDNKGQNFIKYFLSPYDAIVYIKEHLSSNTVIRVNGNLQYQYYRSLNEIKILHQYTYLNLNLKILKLRSFKPYYLIVTVLVSPKRILIQYPYMLTWLIILANLTTSK